MQYLLIKWTGDRQVEVRLDESEIQGHIESMWKFTNHKLLALYPLPKQS